VVHNQLCIEDYIPLQHLSENQGKVQVIDSILSEEAALGFEYGYATANPEALVLWEAQFGDFVNGAQAIIDQFIASAEAKWGRLSNLVMLLPHGLEGQGPEHSSGRLERFLQLCAGHNMQVCVPTTASQIFHLLRRQILRKFRAPLIIMTPKSLLRNPLAASPMHKFTEEKFRDVYEEQYDNIKPKKVDRIVMCSGKVFYDLLTRRQDDQINNVAILRLEQLYPFPAETLHAELDKFPNAKELVWCQEEPINQGAWHTSRHNFVYCAKEGQTIDIVARDLCAAPAEGSLRLHNINQNYVIEQALGIVAIKER
jgi:2-oxoglutarate dehydrogenase E1 component